MLNTSKLRKETVEAMQRSGWYEGRKIEIREQIAQLEHEGYKAYPHINEILEELWGIKVKKNIEIRKSGEIEFNSFESGSGEFDRLEIFEPIANEELFPMGMVYAQWFLYIGKSMKVYMGAYKELYMLGNTLEDFLDNTILGIREPELIIKKN